MYKIVKTEYQNINGVHVWVEVPFASERNTLQDGAKICASMNETCKETECYHLQLQ